MLTLRFKWEALVVRDLLGYIRLGGCEVSAQRDPLLVGSPYGKLGVYMLPIGRNNLQCQANFVIFTPFPYH